VPDRPRNDHASAPEAQLPVPPDRPHSDQREPGSGASALRRAPVAIVVPTRDEAEVIAGTLRRLREDFPTCELVVVDGGSRDSTAAIAAHYARVLRSAPGRAIQMNAGARATSAPVLWFVHADCRIERQALAEIETALAHPAVVGGGLTLRFDRRSAGLDYLAWSSNLRARHLHLIFGDQALFVRRSAFEHVGGFPEIPLMEDLELSRRLARTGRLSLLTATSTASARRLVAHGTWSMIVFMQALKAGYLLGVPAERLALAYGTGPPWARRRRSPNLPAERRGAGGAPRHPVRPDPRSLTARPHAPTVTRGRPALGRPRPDPIAPSPPA